MSEMLSDLDLFMLSQLIVRKIRAKQGKLTARKRITNVVIVACTVLATMSILDDINLKRDTVFYPPADFPTYGVESAYWQNHPALFFSRYRFRQPDLLRAMQAMELYGKEIMVGRKGRHVFYPAEVCLLVMLRRLAYPCRFSDLVQEFGIPSNRLCEIFHCMVDIIFEKYHKIIEIETWVPYFDDFAAVFRHYGAPYFDLVGLIDGNFAATCRPGGLGNVNSREDQSEMYSGEKAQHGMKFMAAYFPNGMMAVSGPYKGKVHDGRMFRESGWNEVMATASLFRRFKLFGDSAFALTPFIQAMIKNVVLAQDRAFNALMSRIRIHIEMAFGGHSNLFTFLSFYRSLKVGGKDIGRVYKAAWIMSNIRTTFYGNQLTHELNNAVRMTLDELMARAK